VRSALRGSRTCASQDRRGATAERWMKRQNILLIVLGLAILARLILFFFTG
jgi:hypothetical protein